MSALQIVKTAIGDSCEDGPSEKNEFILNEANLDVVLSKIDQNMEVAVVTVVGAFRTGKSFLLNLLLRYLRDGGPEDLSEAWMTAKGDCISAPSSSSSDGSSSSSSSTSSSSTFSWRGGKDRHTTGIWMWSEPMFRTNPNGSGDMAILLMDTQGMFDNETTMTLTAQIFGLSTMISSFQIYNVDKKIQENNLQDLALFSEYGRAALQPPTGTEGKTVFAGKPFQRLQFLVRDWQNFEQEFDSNTSEEEKDKIIESFTKEMKEYIAEVIKPRQASDLQSTRTQITRCFEQVDCFLLPHPGIEVTKKSYDGNIAHIDPVFRALLNRYARSIFDDELESKVIQGRSITGVELKEYFKSYVKMFQGNSSAFPKATTILAATTEASINNSSKVALMEFESAMEVAMAPGFLKEELFKAATTKCTAASLGKFEAMATFGDVETIGKARTALEADLHKMGTKLSKVNALKNPFKNFEMYVIPVVVAVASRIAASIINVGCDADICVSMVNNLRTLSFLVFLVLLVLCWTMIKGGMEHMQRVLPLVFGAIGAANKAKAD